MSFKLYLAVLFLTFVRPIDGFFPELLEYRPMLVLYGLCGLVTVFSVVASKTVKNQANIPRTILLIFAFVAALVLSHIANGWLGGAVKALSDQSPTIVLFLVTLFNVNTIDRARLAAKTVLMAIFLMSALSIVSLHTGIMFDLLVLRQSAPENTPLPELMFMMGDFSRFEPGFFYRVRGFGFLGDPNDMAQAIVTCVPFLLGAWKSKELLRNLMFRLPALGVMLYAVYLTQSRGAIVGLGAITFYWLYRRFGAALSMTALAIGGVGLIAIGVGGGRSLSSDEASASEIGRAHV